MQLKKGQPILIVVCAAWAVMIAVGLGLLWAYENGPGVAAHPPASWPRESHLNLATDRATLVMTAHPHCPCTRASVGELARLMTQAQGRVTAYVLFLKPEGFSDDWEKTDLWQSAASIPDVSVFVDERGTEARRFHAMTSGQTALYNTEGELLFSGGITGSRGHSGDNAGRSAIVSLLNAGEAEQAETFVFGCPLFRSDPECEEH